MTGIRKIQYRQLLVVIVAWQLVAVLIGVYDHFMIHTVFVTVDEELYSFPLYLLFNMTAVLLASLTAVPLIIFWINEKYIHRSYGQSILLVVSLYLVATVLLIVVMGFPYVSYSTGIPIGDDQFWKQYTGYIFNLFQLKKLLVWAVVVALTQFGLQLDRKFGHGVLWKIITGRYHTPKEEYRIFLFADIKDSTAIAESIGDIKFHLMLRDFFSDITNAVLNNQGSIYTYVGDQVIVSWDKPGNHCIRCFFDMKKSIEARRDVYMHRYGLVPDFKGGMHAGVVIAGEIGIIKRDITYSGDVLNTTSRIQDKCAELDVPLLLSNDFFNEIVLDPRFTARYMGEMKLKGKKKDIGLQAVALRDAS